MKNICKKINSATTRLYVRGCLLRQDCANMLTNEDGGSHTIEIVLAVILVIVLVVRIIFPKLFQTLEGTLDNADSKIDALWDYNG